MEPGPSRGQDLVQPLKSFFGGFLMFVTCPRLQSHLHVRGTAHLAAASHAPAYFQLFCWKNERKTRLKTTLWFAPSSSSRRGYESRTNFVHSRICSKEQIELVHNSFLSLGFLSNICGEKRSFEFLVEINFEEI